MRSNSFLLILAICIGLTSCKNIQDLDGSKKEGPTLSTSASSKDRPSEENVGLPGYKFECNLVSVSTSVGSLDCGMKDESNNYFDFSADGNQLTAEIESKFADSFALEASSDPLKPLKYNIDSTLYEISLDELFEISTLSVTIQIDGNTVVQEHQVSKSLEVKELSSFSIYRIYIDSIENTASLFHTACISSLEMNENGVWLDQLQKDPLQTNIGDYVVVISASSFISDPLNILIENGTHWESGDVFQSSEPFDAKEETWIEIEFLFFAPKIEAIRFNSFVQAEPLTGECYPDRLRVSGSSDGIEFTEIHQQAITNPSSLPDVLLKWN